MSKTHHAGSTYKNPWAPGFSFRTSAGAILKGPLARSKPFEVDVEPVKTVKCDFGLYGTEDARKGICTTWLGHAVCWKYLMLGALHVTLLYRAFWCRSTAVFELCLIQSSRKELRRRPGSVLGGGCLPPATRLIFRKSTILPYHITSTSLQYHFTP